MMNNEQTRQQTNVFIPFGTNTLILRKHFSRRLSNQANLVNQDHGYYKYNTYTHHTWCKKAAKHACRYIHVMHDTKSKSLTFESK